MASWIRHGWYDGRCEVLMAANYSAAIPPRLIRIWTWTQEVGTTKNRVL